MIRSNGGRITGLLEKLRALTAGLETKAVQTAINDIYEPAPRDGAVPIQPRKE